MSTPETSDLATSRRLRTETLVVLIAVALAATMAGAYYFMQEGQEGPAQPISFSHRFHVSTKKLNCFFCHSGGVDTARAGVPPVETCMLCHSRIIVDHPEIVALRGYYDARRPLEWVRVNDLPDYVYFDHSAHTHRGIDCGQCHGDVAGMDRVAQVRDFQMGFCVECHEERHVTRDCLACHR